MPISPAAFAAEFDTFKTNVRRKSNQTFVSFRQGLPFEWEGYKRSLREDAVRTLDAANWRADEIGAGRIIECVVRAIESPRSASGDKNNLLRWENRYGHANRSHRALLDSRTDPVQLKRFESCLYDLYHDKRSDAESFRDLLDLAGKRYDLLAYLFFLKDAERFMPIGTTTFDEAFRSLGSSLVTQQRCSWDNYEQFNLTLAEISEALRTAGGVADADLLDAHSFCWMLVRLKLKLAAGEEQPRTSPKKGTVKVYDIVEKWIWRMAETVERTVAGAQGQIIEKTVKLKELRMSRAQLEELIRVLIERQEGRCALTGIPLQYSEKDADPQLLASVDRIDSSGHYDTGNLQIVCRFVNFWKSDMADEEFRRLLSLVRRDELALD